MAAMPDIEADARRAVGWFEQHLPRHHQTPATTPAITRENPMSIATLEDDFRNGVAAVKNEIGKLEQNLPGMVAEAKTLAASPLGQLAITAANHVAAGILPPEGLAMIEKNAARLLDDVLSLYHPNGVPAPAQAQ